MQNLLRSAKSAVECVERACEQIRSSERLATVLRAVLATGNTLNCGTHRGNATAIKLDSLSKTSDVKVRACNFVQAGVRALRHQHMGTSQGATHRCL